MPLLEAIDEHPAVQAARELKYVLGANREAADSGARMTPEVHKALGAAGMFRLVAPVEVGGHEVPLSVMAAVLEELAAGDPGAAWHLANSPMAGMVSASLEPNTRDQVFADPTACYSYSAMPAGLARRVEGGYEINGRWPFVTGVRDSRWAVLSAMIHADGEPPKPSHPRLGQPLNASAIRTFVVPCDALVVEDTWSRAAAMRSSGSHAARAEAVFVPDDLVYSFIQPRVLDRSFYRMSPGVVFASAAAAIAVGVLRGALDATIETAGKKRSSLDGMAWAEHASVRTGVARASAVHHCIRTGLLTALDELQQRYETTANVPAEDRAIAWATIFHVADEARTAVSSLAGPASSQAFISGHGLEMAIRDIHAIVVSLEVMRNLEEAAGSVLLGGEPGNILF